MHRLTLGDLLCHFSTNDVAQALVRAGLPGGGAKIERVELLRTVALDQRLSAHQVLEYFASEALRRIASGSSVRASTKAEIINALVASLTEPFPPPPRVVALTLDSIRAYVESLGGSYRQIASEADAEYFLQSALRDHFDDVRTQVPVPGHFGHRIDIDIQGGKFGIEVKLATTLIDSSSEAYRLLGQAFYYDRRRYAGRLLVVIVGPPYLGSSPVIGEVLHLLGALGVAGMFLPAL